MMPTDIALEGLRLRWMARPADAFAAAREWLAAVAGAEAAATLHRDPRGRPRLPPGLGDVGWSHSAGRLLLAHADAGRVGVDIEAAARRTDPLRVARRYFAADELARLHALDEHQRVPAFLRLWCAKEAVLKAHGHGLAFGLHRLALDVAGEHPRLLRCDPALGDAGDWRLLALAPEPGFIAVLAHAP